MHDPIGKFVEQRIKLADLELDLNNPRTGSQSDQRAAISAMLSRKSIKLEQVAQTKEY